MLELLLLSLFLKKKYCLIERVTNPFAIGLRHRRCSVKRPLSFFFSSPQDGDWVIPRRSARDSLFSSLVVSGIHVVTDTIHGYPCTRQENKVTTLTTTPENFGASVIDENITDAVADTVLSACTLRTGMSMHFFVDVLVANEVFILYKNLI